MKFDYTYLYLGVALLIFLISSYLIATINRLKHEVLDWKVKLLKEKSITELLSKELFAIHDKYTRQLVSSKKDIGDIEKMVDAMMENYEKAINKIDTEKRILILTVETFTLRLGNISEQLAICEDELGKRDAHISKLKEAGTEKDIAYAKLHGEYKAEQANSQSWKDSAIYWQNKHTEAIEQLSKHLDVPPPPSITVSQKTKQ